MLRIWTDADDATGTSPSLRLRLEGQVRGPWVAELARVVESVLERGITPTIDLAGVRFLDPQAVALLRSLRDRRVHIENCSPLTAEQLRS